MDSVVGERSDAVEKLNWLGTHVTGPTHKLRPNLPAAIVQPSP